MVRKKGTLINFLGDGEITTDGIKWCIHTGKVPVGKERTMLIERTQLEAWGILKKIERDDKSIEERGYVRDY
jgi:hypothetical protein